MDCSQPKWILDRRGSGFLFWRREEEARKQVKFRCEVEVLEFLPLEAEEEMDSPSALAAGICLILIATTLYYQWFFH